MNCTKLPPAHSSLQRLINGLDGGTLLQRAAVILANKDEIWETYMRRLAAPEGGLETALPLRVGFVVFVPLMFDHPEAADADVWSGHLHPVQSDPARGGEERKRKRKRKAA